jgi:hypothetical protein
VQAFVLSPGEGDKGGKRREHREGDGVYFADGPGEARAGENALGRGDGRRVGLEKEKTRRKRRVLLWDATFGSSVLSGPRHLGGSN